MLSLLVADACQEVVASKGILRDKRTAIFTFILLNHTNLTAEINTGAGDYLDSLLSELNISNNETNLKKLKNIKQKTHSTYEFAKVVVDEF